MILLDAERIAASRPNRALFTDVSLTVSAGDRIGVVGLNGCGKSTLLRILGGDLEPEAGEVRRRRDLHVGFLAQHPVLPLGRVGEIVGGGWQGEAMLDRLGMAGLLEVATGELSGGQAKRVALARLLHTEHDCLILDEPTNHLDLDGIRFLEGRLAAFSAKKTTGLVLVTHDRHLLDGVTTKVLEIDRGSAYLHVPSGRHAGSGYAAYLAGRAEREARAETAEQVRRNLASRELAWLRRGAPARSTKPKARVAAANALVHGQAPSAARSGGLGLSSALGNGTKRLGSRGIELEAVGFSWPDGREVLSAATLRFEPGDRVGIVGPNGAGKSTLLDLIAGRLTPTVGAVERGATVAVGYYDQLGRGLDVTQRVREAVAGDKGAPSVDDVTLMKRFWFDGDAQFAPIATLSGGERRRLQLLLTLVHQPNVLLLDEPTNDLDLDTLRAMEDFLETWPGIVVAVSHDRVFLDRTTDELLALDGRAGVRWVRGGVEAWIAEHDVDRATTEPRAVTGVARAVATSARALSRPSASPSTVRRNLARAARDLETATTTRDELAAAFAAADGHEAHDTLGRRLATLHAQVEECEAEWLRLAEQAEALGLES